MSERRNLPVVPFCFFFVCLFCFVFFQLCALREQPESVIVS